MKQNDQRQETQRTQILRELKDHGKGFDSERCAGLIGEFWASRVGYIWAGLGNTQAEVLIQSKSNHSQASEAQELLSFWFWFWFWFSCFSLQKVDDKCSLQKTDDKYSSE